MAGVTIVDCRVPYAELGPFHPDTLYCITRCKLNAEDLALAGALRDEGYFAEATGVETMVEDRQVACPGALKKNSIIDCGIFPIPENQVQIK